MQTPARDPEIPRLHADYVRKLARSLVFDDATAEDVAQETWLAALEHGPRDRRSLRGWLATLVRNLAWKAWRGESRRSRREQAAARPESVPSAEEILERESARRSVIDAVLALEEPYRSTIVLRYFESLEPREVARRLEVPVETVRTREKRAREMLRARLDREHGLDRRAWSLALVRELRVDPPGYGWPIVAKSILSGGVVMSTVKIVAGASAALLVVLGTLAWLEHRREPAPSSDVETSAAASLERATSEARRPDVEPERVLEHEGGPARTAAEDPRGSLLVRVRWGDDHSPAADVGLQAEDEPGQDEFRWIDARTGPDGTWKLDHLRPGKHLVYSDRLLVGQKRWEGVPVEIEPNRVAELDFEIAPGITVDGEVVDERGEPVADAVILLAPDQTGWISRPVAQSATDGRFCIRAAPPGACLCAYLAGRFPSLRPRLRGSVGSESHVRLVLPGAGGALEGVVTDSEGAPIADAKVLVGFEDYRDVRFVEGESVYGPVGRLASTDERGRFRLEGLAPGSPAIGVRAPGFAQWKGTTEVHAGETTRGDVRLSDQVIVEGSVHDGDGRPLAGVLVGLEGPETFLWVSKKTSEDGAYRLVGLPVGAFHLKATMRDIGGADVDLHGVAGGVLRWDAVLSSGRTIAGRIVGPTTGLGTIVVEARPKLGRVALGRLGMDGMFRLTELEDKPYDVVAVLGANHVPLASALAVSPGGPEVVLEIDRAKLPSSRIRGRLIGPEGKPVDGEVRLSLRDGNRFRTSTVAQSNPETGSFEAEKLVPGEWELSIASAGLVRRSIPARALAAEETWDLGDVELSRGGVLVVVAKMEDGSNPPAETEETSKAPPRFFVTDGPSTPVESLTAVGNEARSSPLAPGPHVLRIQASLDPPIAGATVPFEIAVGRETRLDVVLRAGKRVKVAIRDPWTTPSDIRVFVTTKDGTYVGFSMLGELHEGRHEAAFRLLDGEYRVKAVATDGRNHEGTIVVTADGPDTLEPELKSP